MKVFLRPIIPLTLVALPVFAVAAARPPPNIVVILADDFGVGDIQAHYPDNNGEPQPGPGPGHEGGIHQEVAANPKGAVQRRSASAK